MIVLLSPAVWTSICGFSESEQWCPGLSGLQSLSWEFSCYMNVPAFLCDFVFFSLAAFNIHILLCTGYLMFWLLYFMENFFSAPVLFVVLHASYNFLGTLIFFRLGKLSCVILFKIFSVPFTCVSFSSIHSCPIHRFCLFTYSLFS